MSTPIKPVAPPVPVTDRLATTPVTSTRELDTREWRSAVALPLKLVGGTYIIVDEMDRPDHFEVIVETFNVETHRIANCCDAASAATVMSLVQRIIEIR